MSNAHFDYTTDSEKIKRLTIERDYHKERADRLEKQLLDTARQIKQALQQEK